MYFLLDCAVLPDTVRVIVQNLPSSKPEWCNLETNVCMCTLLPCSGRSYIVFQNKLKVLFFCTLVHDTYNTGVKTIFRKIKKGLGMTIVIKTSGMHTMKG